MDRSRWDFEAAGLEDCRAEDWSHGKPVLNTEFGYQHEPGYESEVLHDLFTGDTDYWTMSPRDLVGAAQACYCVYAAPKKSA